jgi:hypothetical protein
MFFNKLREEVKEEFKKYFTENIETFKKAIIPDIIQVILINNNSIEELITKYHRKKWSDISPFEVRLLKEKFSLIERMGITFIYDAHYFYMSDWIEDTLIKVKNHNKCYQEEKKCIPIPLVTDKDKLNAISAIVEYQKSTVKAVKAIKEVLKDVE